MHCLNCFSEVILEVTWTNLFTFEKPLLLCEDCHTQFVFLQEKRCKKCSRESDEDICSDCLWWEKVLDGDVLEWNYSLFTYNTFMKDIIAKWKYRGDYVLGYAFKAPFFQVFHEVFSFLAKEAIIVPIPLSEERLHERRFNQAEMLAGFLPIKTENVLFRKHTEKQSKKKRKERILAKNPFFMEETINKTVILVDDIYTTGTTLRHAASILKKNGCPTVYAFTLIRG